MPYLRSMKSNLDNYMGERLDIYRSFKFKQRSSTYLEVTEVLKLYFEDDLRINNLDFTVLERIILLWMLYFVLLCNTLVTVNLNVAIISMVRSQQGVQEDLNHTKVLLCPNTTFLWGQNNQESSSASLLQVTLVWTQLQDYYIYL